MQNFYVPLNYENVPFYATSGTLSNLTGISMKTKKHRELLKTIQELESTKTTFKNLAIFREKEKLELQKENEEKEKVKNEINLKLDQKNTELELLKTETKKLENDFGICRKEKFTLQDKYDSLVQSYEYLQNTKKSEIEQLKDNYKLLEDEHKILQSEFTNLKTMFHNLRTEYLKSKGENVMKEIRVKNLKQVLEDYKKTVESDHKYEDMCKKEVDKPIFKCYICLEYCCFYADLVSCQKGHKMCRSCFSKLAKKECPICKNQELTPENIETIKIKNINQTNLKAPQDLMLKRNEQAITLTREMGDTSNFESV